MEVHLIPELEAKLNAMAAETGRATDALVQDAVAGSFEELAQVRAMLDRRYDEVKSGIVKPRDGAEFFQSLRQREDELL
jgi:predicted DNA-binding protein